MRKPAIYVRQSADRADSVSLETQEALCRLDLPPDAEAFVFSDRGCSGKNTDRPALQAMMAAVRADEISEILVYKLDRISRNLTDFTHLLEICREHGISFRSHTEQFETATPMGQAMQSLLMVFAQLERETISARVRDAAFARAKLGFDTGGPPPTGFRRTAGELHGKRTNILMPDTDAPHIIEAFSMYLHADASLSAICRKWDAAGFRTPHSGTWSPNVLCRILRNPVYVQANAAVFAYLSERGAELCVPAPIPPQHAVILYADRRMNRSRFTDLHGVFAVSAPHIGLVAPEIWLGCQKKLDDSRKKRTRGKGARTWLSGSIFCMRCGAAMTAVRGRSTDYLICGGKKRGKCAGAGAVWRVETAEKLVGELLARQLDRLRTGIFLPEDDPAQQQTLDRLTLRRAELFRCMADPNGGEIALLAAAAADLEAQYEAVSAQKAKPQSYAVHLPEWNETDADTKKTITQTLLRCIMADGNTLHLFLK